MGVTNIWTNEELNFLSSHEGMSDAEIGKYLNRSAYSVHDKRRRVRKGYDFPGCDDDCFNCKFPDCLKPERLF